jgi:hypothetical protein
VPVEASLGRAAPLLIRLWAPPRPPPKAAPGSCLAGIRAVAANGAGVVHIPVAWKGRGTMKTALVVLAVGVGGALLVALAATAPVWCEPQRERPAQYSLALTQPPAGSEAMPGATKGWTLPEGAWALMGVIIGVILNEIRTRLQYGRTQRAEKEKAQRERLLERLTKAYNPVLEAARRPIQYLEERGADEHPKLIRDPAQEFDLYLREVRPIIYREAHLFSPDIMREARQLDGENPPLPYIPPAAEKREEYERRALCRLPELYALLEKEHASLSVEYRDSR